MKKITLVFLIIILIGSSVSSLRINKENLVNQKNRSSILYVGGSGPGNYTKIQDAIDNASDDNSVFVFNGTYYENIIINKSINLLGEDKNITIIDGGFTGNVIIVTSDFVNISGFTVQNGKHEWNFSGIKISSSMHNTVKNNILSNNYNGIYLHFSSNNKIIYNDANHNNWSGIILWSSNYNSIINNNAKSNQDMGIDIRFSKNNIIMGNNISDHFMGLSMWYCNYNIVMINNLSNNKYGIKLKTSIYNNIKGNNASNNKYGILIITESHNNNFTANIANLNLISGILIGTDCKNNHIYHNCFMDNTENAHDSCDNIWDNNYPSGGNYWDDYNGIDSNGDGIGDTPYQIPGWYNYDRYPLMKPPNNNPPYAPTVKGPNTGYSNATYSFEVVTKDLDGDKIFYCIDWGDGSYNEWIGPFNSSVAVIVNHVWNRTGVYEIKAIAKDVFNEKSDWSNKITFVIEKDEDISPVIKITKPDRGLYIFNKKILSRIFRLTKIIGRLTIEAIAYDNESGIKKVEFYLNGQYKSTDTKYPYTYDWKWNRPCLFHRYIIKVVAYDYAGNTAIDRMLVRKIL